VFELSANNRFRKVCQPNRFTKIVGLGKVSSGTDVKILREAHYIWRGLNVCLVGRAVCPGFSRTIFQPQSLDFHLKQPS
jgi:hypothetical protein